MATTSPLKWKKFHPLTDQNAFICLVDSMGNDSSIVQAARVSYGKDERLGMPQYGKELDDEIKARKANRQLIRYLLNHGHTTPFEMVELKFMVQVPMDCWRQWIRHRTASVNEYSTRYTEALDFFQVTAPTEWRLQATDNKQGSSGFLNAKGKGQETNSVWDEVNGDELSKREEEFHEHASNLYKHRLAAGIAKEQARKDLPLSTYTRAYWKCDLHNIFNFLRLRMDSHAQLEIRRFANCMFEIVKQLCPVACEAFEDYVLNAKKFSAMEMEVLRVMVDRYNTDLRNQAYPITKPDNMTDREWKQFLEKLT